MKHSAGLVTKTTAALKKKLLHFVGPVAVIVAQVIIVVMGLNVGQEVSFSVAADIQNPGMSSNI